MLTVSNGGGSNPEELAACLVYACSLRSPLPALLLSACSDESTVRAPAWQGIGSGDAHCVIPYNRYWWETSADEWSSGETAGGTTLDAWLTQMVDGAVVRPVDCTSGEAGACTVGLEQL